MRLVVLIGDQDIGGLHVAVHERLRMRGVEGLPDLPDDARGGVRFEHAAAGDEGLEVGALDVVHGDEEVPVVLARLKHRDHVRVPDRRGQSRLALEADAEAVVLRELVGDQLERDEAVEVDVDGAKDHAHPAASGHGLDAVAGDLITWCELGHG